MNDDDGGLCGLALVEAAEAEAAEAEARAEAATARARAVRLRHELGTAAGESDPHVSDPDEPDPQPRRIGRPRPRTVVGLLGVLVLAALLVGNGLLAWHHHGENQDRRRAEAFAAAARDGVVNMTTLDFNKADADVARVLDGATGEFRTDFAGRVDDFTSVVRDSKVVTAGSVTATGIESMTRDSAVVLVAATSTVTNAAGVKEAPRKWRLSVTVARDGDRLKMSKVEFVR